MRSAAFAIALLLTTATLAPAQSGPRPAWHSRAANFKRAGWVVVNGRFVKPQTEVKRDELFRFDTAGPFNLIAKPAARIEPLIKNYRTSLVTLEGSPFAFTLGCVGRVWNDTKSAGSQHLTLSAVEDGLFADETMRLTRIEITPTQQVAQAIIQEDGDPISVIVVFGPNFTEATIGLFGKPPKVLIRSTDARTLYRERPIEMRKYVTPLLKLLTGGPNPLAPAAGDVYRAFPEMPADATAAAAVAAEVPKLASGDPRVRQRASDTLAALGPRGVQAVLRLDRSRLPPEAAARVADLIAAATTDPRPADALRADPNFLLDCLNDPDANVRAAAGALVRR